MKYGFLTYVNPKVQVYSSRRTSIDSRKSRRDRDLRSVITAAINHTGKLHRGLLVMRVLLADEYGNILGEIGRTNILRAPSSRRKDRVDIHTQS